MLEKRFEAEAATRNENFLPSGITPNIEIWGEGAHGGFGNLNAVYGTPHHLFSPTSSVPVCCGVGRVKERLRKAYYEPGGRRSVVGRGRVLN